MDFNVSFGLINGRLWELLQIIHEMASLWFVLDLNGSFELVTVDFLVVVKILQLMGLVWLGMDFDDILGLMKANCG